MYGVGLSVSIVGYARTSQRNSVSSTLIFLYLTEHFAIMRKIKLFIAASIDGNIAESDGGLDWLMKYPVNSETNYGYDDFFNSIDTVIMGGRTYRDILNMDFTWPYKDKTTYVLTRNSQKSKDDIHFISDNIIEFVSELRNEGRKDIWLVGGGEIISLFLSHELIDEMIITTIPVILGDGIALFPKISKDSKWETIDFQKYSNDVTQVHYVIKR